MPSTATITAFNQFTAQTLIRSAQMNANFDVFRGHIIPVDPNTSTASDATYDLGASSYRWNDLHLSGDLILGGVTISGISSIYSKTATGSFTAGVTITAAASINIAGTTTGNGFDEEVIFIIGDTTTGTDITTGVDQVRDGNKVGQRVILMGTSDTSTVALQDGNNLQLNGDFTFYKYSSLELIWGGTADGWCEIARRD